MFNVFKHKPGNISTEDLREVIETDNVAADAQHPALGATNPTSTGTYQTPEEQEDPFNPPQPNVLPAGGVIGAQPETTHQNEVDPRVTHELGTDALHGTDFNKPA